jgi:hypothetical protein
VAVLEIPTEYGTLTYHFKQSIQAKTDYDKIFNDAKSHDREVGVSASLMARVMSSFSNVLTERNKTVVIESKEKNNQAFCISAEDENFTIEQLVMPVRLAKR